VTRVLYLSPSRFPSVRAHARQAAEMCAAFAACGARVTLAHPDLPPRGPVPPGLDLFDHLGLPRTFRALPLPCPGLPEMFGPEPDFDSRLWRILAHGSMAFGAIARLLREPRGEPVLLYSREKYAAFLAPMLRPVMRLGIVIEVHDLWRPLSAGNRRLLKRADGIVVIHPALRDALIEAGLPAEAILVEPDAAREVPPWPPSRDEARRALGLPLDARLVVYTGHLYASKGADVLARAMRAVPWASAMIVGGLEDDRRRLADLVRDEEIAGVRLIGHVSPAEAARYQAAADVLVLPTRPLDDNARRYTSPLKLAEYRSAGRPIVASDVPSLRAWLTHDETAWMVPPDDPDALADGLRLVLNDAALAERLAIGAREGLEHQTWRARAERVLEFARRRTTRGPLAYSSGFCGR
jgi:glycosyltransferase involved in cell wall biosynthesis